MLTETFHQQGEVCYLTLSSQTTSPAGSYRAGATRCPSRAPPRALGLERISWTGAG